MYSHLSPGTLLQNGKYRIVRFIKSGGFGCTYEAENTYFKERIAIKEFFVKDLCKDDVVNRLKSKFLAEARVLHGFQHPGIVHVSDVFEENDTVYYVMDFIEGASLDVYLKKHGPLPEEEAVGYIRQVCDALKYIHGQKRLHLDVKPGNIMLVEKDKSVILIDFGTVKHFDDPDGEYKAKMLSFTPGYAAPEQENAGTEILSPATDIYALGATLYKLLTGITPPSQHPLPLSVSQPTRSAVSYAMRPSVKERPQNIEEFLAALDVCLSPDEDEDSDETKIYDGEGHGEQEDDVKVKGDKTIIIKGDESDKDSDSGSDARKSRRWLWVVLMIAAAVTGVLIAYAYLTREAPAPVPSPPVVQKEDVAVDVPVEEDEPVLAGDSGTYRGHEWVDLGLSVKWAVSNVPGPDDAGGYYAWGEIATKSRYLESNCISYGRGWEDIGGNQDRDVAKALWGGRWRIPTKEELEELVDKCLWKWKEKDGAAGYEVKGPNGNSIFLPAAGYRSDAALHSYGTGGDYWSSTPYEKNDRHAYALIFNQKFKHVDWYCSDYGRSIRPVIK